MSLLEIVKKVEMAGYGSIYKVEVEENNKYKIKALDKNGKKVKLEIDASTGNINKKLFD